MDEVSILLGVDDAIGDTACTLAVIQCQTVCQRP